MSIQRTPVELFTAAVPLQARERYRGNLRAFVQTRHSRFAGGVVPDLYKSLTRRMHDVMTTGFRLDFYEAGLSNVNAKEATVQHRTVSGLRQHILPSMTRHLEQ